MKMQMKTHLFFFIASTTFPVWLGASQLYARGLAWSGREERMRAKRRSILPFHLNTVNIASVVSSDPMLIKEDAIFGKAFA